MREALQQEPILVKSPHAPSRDCLSFAWPQFVPSLYLAVVESYRGQAERGALPGASGRAHDVQEHVRHVGVVDPRNVP